VRWRQLWEAWCRARLISIFYFRLVRVFGISLLCRFLQNLGKLPWIYRIIANFLKQRCPNIVCLGTVISRVKVSLCVLVIFSLTCMGSAMSSVKVIWCASVLFEGNLFVWDSWLTVWKGLESKVSFLLFKSRFCMTFQAPSEAFADDQRTAIKDVRRFYIFYDRILALIFEGVL
jgi:hypothetical protein